MSTQTLEGETKTVNFHYVKIKNKNIILTLSRKGNSLQSQNIRHSQTSYCGPVIRAPFTNMD